MKVKFTLGMMVFLLSLSQSYANNVQVSNVTLTGQNAANNTYQVQFDISWENSWRTSTFESNYDAVWIFFKFRETPQLNWQHGSISTTGFVEPTGGTINVPLESGSSGYGAFLHRTSDGIGDVNYTSVELKWNYGFSFEDDVVIEICVFAIEMVYIPSGSFLVGDASNTPEGNFEMGNTNASFSITSENTLTLGGTSSANLSNSNAISMATVDDYNYAITQTLPANYPKGFDPFYVMKYEMSQGQYAAYLNKLTTSAAEARFPGQFGIGNHTVTDTGVAPELYIATSPDRACNFLNWGDVASYADWSGLRPMSELEYEKICRGTRPSSPDEFAWGDPFIYNQNYSYASPDLPEETILNPVPGAGNAIYNLTRGPQAGPRRCGMAAASILNPSRREAGASYYGVMEMTGNVWELAISTGSVNGRNFNGNNHGNGIISNSTGNSTVAGWPPVSGASNALGTGVRGGGHPSSAPKLRVSSRDLANTIINSRFTDVSGRLVRSKL